MANTRYLAFGGGLVVGLVASRVVRRSEDSATSPKGIFTECNLF